MRFEVLNEFQANGINYEVGNAHAKHGLEDAYVLVLHGAGFVSVEGLPDVRLVPSAVVVKPDDFMVITRN